MADTNDPDVPPIPLPPESASTPIPAPEPAPAPPASPYATAPQAPVPPAPYGQQQPYGQAAYGQQAYQQPAAYGQRPYGAYQNPSAGAPQGVSIASLICGIAGIIGIPFVPLAAIILGHIGQKNQPYAKGLWLTGLITGYVGLVFYGLIYAFIFIVAFAGAAGGFS